MRLSTCWVLSAMAQSMFALLLLLVAGASCPGQSSLRAWGDYGFDTEGRVGRYVQVSAGVYSTAVLRSDGRIFVNGVTIFLNSSAPELPNGLRYVGVDIVDAGGVGVVSDGTVRVWGQYPTGAGYVDTLPPAQMPPPGVKYVKALIGGDYIVALRDDGLVDAWGGNNQSGQLNVPSFPAGVVALDVVSANYAIFALLSDGSILGWGDNSSGQLQVPTLPVGVTFKAMAYSSAGPNVHYLALRSDGLIAGWGDNQWGQIVPPALPAGVEYTAIAAGDDASCAARSDGILAAWGYGGAPVLQVPTVPAGLRVVQLEMGYQHAAALLSDGSILTWGENSFLQSTVPVKAMHNRYTSVSRGWSHTVSTTVAEGVFSWGEDATFTNVPAHLRRGSFTKAGAGDGFSAALRSDGQLFMWGLNNFGQCNVLPLPPGVSYTDFRLAFHHTIAVRSDGQAVAWGDPAYGMTTIPALPAGVHYVACDARDYKSVLLRSDGQIEVFGWHYGNPSQMVVPALPQGLRYVEIGAATNWNIAIRSDGSATWWGSVNSTVLFWKPLSALSLPFGVYYVEVDCDYNFAMLRRSDGLIDICGDAGNVDFVPALDPGTSYVQVAGGRTHTATARVGPTETYISFAHGCAGTMPATRLVPRDTPRIGKTLEVRLFDLPVDIALMTMGLASLSSPIALDGLGMPGCTAEVSIDAVLPLVGQDNQAVWSLPIPNLRSLVGLRFYNQAVVLDPGVNALGLVTSDAAEGVVGDG